MDKVNKHEVILHYTMAFTGGIFGMYTLLDHISVFGSAETGNMLLMIKNFVGGDFFHAFLRFLGVVIYVVGIICALVISEKFPHSKKRISIAIDLIAALVLPFFPNHVDPIISIYPVSFAMSIQWCTFGGIGSNVCASTFSTNNLRQFVTALFYRLTKGDKSQNFKIYFYLFTLLSFHTGAICVSLLWKYVSDYSIWIALIPITVAFFTENIKCQHKK